MIQTYHEDIIHDLAFNYYGNRFATVSSDCMLKIFTKVDQKWKKDVEHKCHDGPIWRVRWAHPKFGQLLATCSHDKCVRVWEEKKITEEDNDKKLISRSEISERVSILETKEGVADIQFGPKQHGLQLAIAYIDGKLQIYTIHEQNQYVKTCEIMASQFGLRCISWNTSPVEQPMIAAGSFDYQNRFRFNQKNTFLQQNLGQSQQIEQQSTLLIIMKNNAQIESQQSLSIIKRMEQTLTVNDVAWANQNGRSFHLLACADQKGFKCWKFQIKGQQVDILTLIQIKQDFEGPACRLSWNILANYIAVSFENKVRTFKLKNDQMVCTFEYIETQQIEDYNK